MPSATRAEGLFNTACEFALAELPLLLRMLMRRFAESLRLLAMRLGRFGMHLGLIVLALLVVVSRLAVMMRGRLVFRGRILMLRTLGVSSPWTFTISFDKRTIHDVSGRAARLSAVTNITDPPADMVAVSAAPRP